MINPFKIPPALYEYFSVVGAGRKGAHVIITSTNPFEGSSTHYVYALETYSDAVTFTSLEEDGEDVESGRLDPGGSGYPERTLITGKFTRVVPASGSVVAGFAVEEKLQ